MDSALYRFWCRIIRIFPEVIDLAEGVGAEFGVVLESEVVLQDGGYQAGKARVSGKGGVVEMVGQDFADEVGVHVHGAWTVWWGVDGRAGAVVKGGKAMDVKVYGLPR